MLPGRIKAARKEKGLTQEQLAALIGVKRAVISKYESGLIEPSIKQVDAIASALGVDPNWLMTGVDLEQTVKGFINSPGPWVTRTKDDPYIKITSAFDKLNEKGQSVAIERVEELAKISDYQK